MHLHVDLLYYSLEPIMTLFILSWSEVLNAPLSRGRENVIVCFSDHGNETASIVHVLNFVKRSKEKHIFCKVLK